MAGILLARKFFFGENEETSGSVSMGWISIWICEGNGARILQKGT